MRVVIGCLIILFLTGCAGLGLWWQGMQGDTEQATETVTAGRAELTAAGEELASATDPQEIAKLQALIVSIQAEVDEALNVLAAHDTSKTVAGWAGTVFSLLVAFGVGGLGGVKAAAAKYLPKLDRSATATKHVLLIAENAIAGMAEAQSPDDAEKANLIIKTAKKAAATAALVAGVDTEVDAGLDALGLLEASKKS